MPVVRIKVPDVVLDEREETDEELNKQKKEAKKKAKNEIACKKLKNVCALHNSNGGTLELFSTHANPLKPDSVIMAVEELSQNVFNIFEILKTFKICDQTTNSITLRIQRSPMRYDIFLPTETQVLEVRPVDSIAKREIRQRMDIKICELNQDEVPTDFILGNSSGLMQESQTVQFKNLKTDATSKITFVNRVIHNKFTHYVSAFANHRGGRIYYGIKDDGVVAGEKLSDDEQVRIRDRITKVIGKMRCHGASGSSGVKSEINFAPVKNDADQTMESIFVMIVLIKPFLGIVFTKEPESYRIEQEEVVKINFDDWLMHFKMGEQPWAISVIPPADVSDRVQWTSKRNRDIYLQFTVALVQYRNDNDMEKFNFLRELAKKDEFKGTDASLIVRLENVAVHYKKHEFGAASKLLERLKLAIKESRDPEFHRAKVLYLKSKIKRAQGNYEHSYKLSKMCYQVVAALPAEFITVWCYMQLAMLANILGARENDPSGRFLEAQHWLQLASRDACALNQYPTGLHDLQQKLYIYRAMTLLKCSLIGEVSSLDVPSEHINAAVQELTSVYKSFMKGNVMSQYREIQYLFAQCSLFLRYSEDTANNPLKRHEFLKRAQRWVDEAKDLATKCDFNDMEGYATSFQNIVKTQEELIIEEINKYPQLLTLLKLK